MPRPLTDKQRAFVSEYLVDLNATQAAVRAGYAAKTANREGTRLLSNAVIGAAIRAQQNARGERLQLSADWVVQKLAVTYERAMSAEDFGAAVAALDKLARHFGVYLEHNKQKRAYTADDIPALKRALAERGVSVSWDRVNFPTPSTN